MATTYAVNTTNTTNLCATSYSAISDNFTNRRFFAAADQTADGLLITDILLIRFWLYIAAITGTSGYHLRYASTGTWGPTLNATEADWISTATVSCGIVTPSGVGYASWDVPGASFDPAAIAGFRLACVNEDSGSTESITVNSANNASNKPYLEIQTKTRPSMLPLLGAGSPPIVGVTTTYNELTADGTITQTRPSVDPIPDTP